MARTDKQAQDISWLAAVKEHGPSLDEIQPIWVRHIKIHSPGPVSPPHRHPYCECELLTAGVIVQHVEHEEARREVGSLFFAGPAFPTGLPS